MRYEVEVGIDRAEDQIVFLREDLSIVHRHSPPSKIVGRHGNGVSFASEHGTDVFQFTLPPFFSGLASVPPDQTKFPTALWLRELLVEGVKTVTLDNELLRAASPPGQGKTGLFSGFNMAHLVARLRDSDARAFAAWISHLRTTISDLDDVRVVQRPEDKYRYLVIRYRNGVELPSWTVSDGTLRLLALTLLAYLRPDGRIYLIEEPEVGIHPTAIETVIQSLSSVYDGQVLIASHSPVVLGLAEPEQLLCFHRDKNGTVITPGNEHPVLRDWRSGTNLSELFAAGVLS